jgi:hypothetical protein
VYSSFSAEQGIARELKAMPQWSDEHRDLSGLVTREPRRHGSRRPPIGAVGRGSAALRIAAQDDQRDPAANP